MYTDRVNDRSKQKNSATNPTLIPVGQLKKHGDPIKTSNRMGVGFTHARRRQRVRGQLHEEYKGREREREGSRSKVFINEKVLGARIESSRLELNCVHVKNSRPSCVVDAHHRHSPRPSDHVRHTFTCMQACAYVSTHSPEQRPRTSTHLESVYTSPYDTFTSCHVVPIYYTPRVYSTLFLFS